MKILVLVSWLIPVLFSCKGDSTGSSCKDFVLLKGNKTTGVLSVTVTSYNPDTIQCDDTPEITASNDHISEIGKYKWCAVSRDLLYWYLNFNDTIVLRYSHINNMPFERTDTYIVKDIVSGKRHIDVLQLNKCHNFVGKGSICSW
jgi:hypothetical protein